MKQSRAEDTNGLEGGGRATKSATRSHPDLGGDHLPPSSDGFPNCTSPSICISERRKFAAFAWKTQAGRH